MWETEKKETTLEPFHTRHRNKGHTSCFWQLGLVFFVAILGYANSFAVPFVFDDLRNIVENLGIRDLSNFLDLENLSGLTAHSPALQTTIKTRYIGYLSFALNYHFHGLAVWGYHLVNLIIHIVNGFLVFALARMLLLSSPPASLPTPNPLPLSERYTPLLAALLFVSHPLQTQAVTYVVQRLTSFATLLMLVAILCYLNARRIDGQPKAIAWKIVSLGSAGLAALTKEFTLLTPLFLLLWEAVFTSDGLRMKVRCLWPFAIIPLLPALMAFGQRLLWLDLGEFAKVLEGGAAGPVLSPPEYLITQLRVILTYLRLLFWPTGQNLDYQYPLYHSLLNPGVLAGGFLIAGLVIFGFILTWKARFLSNPQAHRLRLTAFLTWAFLLALVPESSIFPIADVIFEHRLYAPSVWFFILMAFLLLTGLFNVFKQLPIARVWIFLVCCSLVSVLSGVTIARNKVWQTKLSLWQDVVKKSPQKSRPRQNLAVSLIEIGQYEQALIELEEGLVFAPDDFSLLKTLSETYRRLGRLEDAIRSYEAVLRVKSTDLTSLTNLGSLYAQTGRLDLAEQTLMRSIDIDAERADIYFNLAQVYSLQGNILQAERSYLAAIRQKKDYADAHYNLGLLYAKTGKLRLAEEQYKLAIQIKSDFISAYNNLAVVLARQQRPAEAIRWLNQIVKIAPDNQNVRRNLEILSRP